jgi:Cep192 domain 4
MAEPRVHCPGGFWAPRFLRFFLHRPQHVKFHITNGGGPALLGDVNGDGRLDVARSGGNATPPSLAIATIVQQSTVTLSQANLAFGQVALGQSKTSGLILLTNVASTPLSITSFVVGGADSDSFAIATSTCGSPLDPGASCSFSIAFTPDTQNQETATVTISDSAPGGAQIVDLEGRGKS